MIWWNVAWIVLQWDTAACAVNISGSDQAYLGMIDHKFDTYIDDEIDK